MPSKSSGAVPGGKGGGTLTGGIPGGGPGGGPGGTIPEGSFGGGPGGGPGGIKPGGRGLGNNTNQCYKVECQDPFQVFTPLFFFYEYQS